MAHAPSVSITSPSSGSTVYATSYPYELFVAGTVTHDPGNTFLDVSVNGASAYADQFQNATNTPWSFNYVVDEPGTYTIVATAYHGQDDDSATSEVEVVSQTITVDYPAAPAVANDLLDGSLKGKKHGACISAVAHHMGSSDDDQSGTDFSGVAKSDVDAYRAAVDDFLDVDGACRR